MRRIDHRPVPTRRAARSPALPALALAASLGMAAAVATPLPARAADDLATHLLASPDGEDRDVFGGRALRATSQDDAVHLLFDGKDGGAAVEVLLRPRGTVASPVDRTASFDVEFRGPTQGARPAPPWDRVVADLVDTVRTNDPGGLRIAGAREAGPDDGPRTLSSEPPPRMRPGDAPANPALESLDRAMRGMGLALVAAFLLLLPVAGWRLGSELRRGLAAAPGSAAPGHALPWAVAAAVLAGLAARWFAPHLLSMHYMGYVLAHDAATLTDIPKYGPGALALYHLLFQATGTSAPAMAALNAVLGSLLPLAGGALLAVLGTGATGVAAGTILLALAPVMVRDATTESLLVPTTLWTLAGLALVLRHRRTRSAVDLAAGALMLVLAMAARPESLALVPLSLAALWFLAPAAGRPRPGVVAVVAAAAAALLALRVLHLQAWLEVERALGNLPSVFTPANWLDLLARDLPRRALVLWFHLFPAGATVVAAAALVLSARRGAAIAFWGLAAAWTALSLVDLPYVSVPRVQAPAAAWVLLAAGLGVEGLAALRRSLPRLPGLGLAATVALALAGSALVTIPALWARTNAADEADLLDEALAAAAPGPAVLVRRGYLDAPGERAHLHSPDDLFQQQGVVTVGPDAFRAAGAPLDRPVYFLRGTRCWMRSCDGPREEHPACRAMMDGFRLETLVERTVPVRHLPVDRAVRPGQEMDFPWCLADDRQMTLGLYRVLGPRPGSGTAAADAQGPQRAAGQEGRQGDARGGGGQAGAQGPGQPPVDGPR